MAQLSVSDGNVVALADSVNPPAPPVGSIHTNEVARGGDGSGRLRAMAWYAHVHMKSHKIQNRVFICPKKTDLLNATIN